MTTGVSKTVCDYCADAPIPHNLFYFGSLISTNMDNHILRVTRYAPGFLKDFVDFLLFLFFNLCIFLGPVRLSGDIQKAKTLRSRIIWEEAIRRNIPMEQVILFGRPTDHYRANVGGRSFYFHSLPIPERLLCMRKNWDDKFVLKQELQQAGVPVPKYLQFPVFCSYNHKEIFAKLTKPLIVKPRTGSRGRHTVTNISTPEELKDAIQVGKKISAYLVAEEHLEGYICRATFVAGKLLGFYRASAPMIVGDGEQTIAMLIERENKNKPERVEKINITEEVLKTIKRAGFGLDSVLPLATRLHLTHRAGRLFGGRTKEMLSGLHPSFVPILTKAAQVVDLPVLGFDCVVPNPEADAASQRWGIIECNTLPFIDLHYFALEGKPENIAGAIWNLVSFY